MRLVNYYPETGSRDEIRLGCLIDAGVIDIPAAWAWYKRQIHPLPGAPPQDIPALLRSGGDTWKTIKKIVDWFVNQQMASLEADAEKVVKPVQKLRFAPPVPRPPAVRDFYAFEQHVRTARELRGQPVPEEWYQIPVFYYSNPGVIFGPGEDIPYPAYTRELDYELEIACIIGQPGRDLTPDQALGHIAGYTIMNDWSARDVQRQETRVGLGPAKAKDFATSFGPCLVTPDELTGKEADRPGIFNLDVRARIKGIETTHANTREMHYSFGEMLARASQSVTLLPGDLIGSGTIGGGCLLEQTRGLGPWLKPGDTVEFEVECLGKLVNRVGSPQPPR